MHNEGNVKTKASEFTHVKKVPNKGKTDCEFEFVFILLSNVCVCVSLCVSACVAVCARQP